MSATFDRASSQYLSETIIGWAVKPVTLSAWIKTDDLVNNQGILTLTDNNDEFIHIQARVGIAGDPAGALEYDTAWKVAESSTSITTEWHHVLGVFTNATSRIIYLDGAGRVENTETQSANMEDMTRILIGTHKTVGGAFFSGNIAEVAIWQTGLSEAQAVLLANGVNPTTIEFPSLSKYWPLTEDGSSGLDGGDEIEGSAAYDSGESPSVGGIFNYPTSSIQTIKRVVAAGNDEIWYEDV